MRQKREGIGRKRIRKFIDCAEERKRHETHMGEMQRLEGGARNLRR